MISRRRFIALAASAACVPGAGQARSRWSGIALGAEAQITLTGPRDIVQPMLDRALQEIDRLEDIFSLYRPRSELVRLNTAGSSRHVSVEMRALLEDCDRLHRLTGGMFDPTVQPLWLAHARGGDLAAAQMAVVWHRVRRDPDGSMLGRGQALTLNGIAQGFVTDRISDLLRAEGFASQLVSIGEAKGDGGPWTVAVQDPVQGEVARRTLRNSAIATSSTGTLSLGATSHILAPTGNDAPRWSTVSVEADSATVADGLSTALCLATTAEAKEIAAALPELRRITLVDGEGDLITLT